MAGAGIGHWREGGGGGGGNVSSYDPSDPPQSDGNDRRPGLQFY